MNVTAFRLLGKAIVRSVNDDVPSEAAALAFYAALSLAPLLMILLWVGGLLGPETQERFIHQIVRLIGRQTGEIVREIVDNVSAERFAGTVSAVLGIITMIVSATGVFGQLHASMNKIWGVRTKKGRDVFAWFRRKLLSLGMVGGAGLVLLVSLAVTTTLRFVFVGQRGIWHWADFGISIVVNFFVFAIVFKILPDVRLRWQDTFPGAALTAVLFALGKFAIGGYLAHSSVGSAYGAAGSLLVLLVWVYYTSLIVFYGAELTQVYTVHQGREIVPLKHATRQ